MSNVTVAARSHPFRNRVDAGIVPAGSNLFEIVNYIHDKGRIHPSLRSSALVTIEGEVVPNEYWGLVPTPGTHVVVSIALHGGGGGGGGKNPFKTILTIAVMIAAPYVGAWAAGTAFQASVLSGGLIGAGSGTMLGMSFSTFAMVARGAFSLVSMMALNAIFPTRPPQLPTISQQSYNDSPTYSINGGSNGANRFGVIPIVLGINKSTPPLGTNSYTEILGDDEYLRMLVIWGYGRLDIADIKIGSTLLTEFDDVSVETREGTIYDKDILIMPDIVYQEPIGVTLINEDGWTQRTSQTNADEISVDITFPRGLLLYGSDGSRSNATITVDVEYRAVGDVTWIAEHTFDITLKSPSVARFGHRWDVENGQYEVRLKNTVVEEAENSNLVDDVSWSMLRTFTNGNPVNFDKPLAMTAIRIKATNQLQGTIRDLSATVSSYVEDWNGSAWVEAISQNPASLFRHVLIGNGSARPRELTQIDDIVLQNWHTFCDTNGYKFNMIRDFKASIWDTLADIASAGRASPTIIDGKWGVIYDDSTKSAVQMFTPRNSWGFQSEKALIDPPHAWRIRFVNEDKDFQQDERIVYDDGYDENSATKFEGLEFPGITNADLIWKFGRYQIAQARLRPEIYKFHSDLEYLICQRGDVIKVSHYVPLWGSAWGRIKSIATSDGNTIGFTSDEEITMILGGSYVSRVRADDGTSAIFALDTIPGTANDVTLTTPVATANGPQVGDLFVFGTTNLETVELIVKSIEPMDNLTAKLTCVDRSSEIYDADTGLIPTFESSISVPLGLSFVAAAIPSFTIQSGTGALANINGAIISQMLVAINPSGGVVTASHYRVRYRLRGTSTYKFVTISADDGEAILTPVIDGEVYEVSAQSITKDGIQSNWSKRKLKTIIGQSQIPSDITGFATNIIDNIAQLKWNTSTDIDISHYRIKWTSALTGATWDNSVDIISNVVGSSVVLPAQIGTYLIKGVDRKGNESATAATASTNISSLSSLNFIDRVSEANPTWPGTFDDAEYYSVLSGIVLATDGELYDAGDLYLLDELYRLGDIFETGSYQLDETVDLSAVYTSRLTASIAVSGIDTVKDFYKASNLFETSNLYGVDAGQYSAYIEVRFTDDDPSGSPTWSEWKIFTIGDYTARGFQFRLQLIGTLPSITPVVSSVEIQIDMPDRMINFSQTVASGGSTITFSPAFYIEPEIGLATINGAEGDKYTITNKSASGFDIAFTNGGSPVSRNISGIARAYGAIT